MPQQNQRSSADDDSNNDHPQTSGDGKSSGNAGAGKSGSEDQGSEKKSADERFGSRKATPNPEEDEGKKDAPGNQWNPLSNPSVLTIKI